jgi:hypothetical protein
MEFDPSKETLDKLSFIDLLQKECSEQGFKLYHCGSWAITAMCGYFFKDLNDIDLVVKTNRDKDKLSKTLTAKGFKFIEEHPWGPLEFEKGDIKIEFGSADDSRNLYFNSVMVEDNYGFINDIKLFVADPLKILQSRYEMIKAGYKKLDDTQKFIIKTVEDFIAFKRLEGTLKTIMAPTKELAHGVETQEWLLKISPSASWQVQISALAHDIERAMDYQEGKTPPKPDKNKHATYDLYKAEHALRSSQIVASIMKEQGFSDVDIKRVSNAIEKHEVGGDGDSDLVRDADSIRWFDKGYSGYIVKSGLEGAKEKGWWMYKRATPETKKLIMSLNFDNEIKNFIKNKSLERQNND